MRFIKDSEKYEDRIDDGPQDVAELKYGRMDVPEPAQGEFS